MPNGNEFVRVYGWLWRQHALFAFQVLRKTLQRRHKDHLVDDVGWPLLDNLGWRVVPITNIVPQLTWLEFLMQLAHPFNAVVSDIMLLLWLCNAHWLQESFSVGPKSHANPWCSTPWGWWSAQAKSTCKVKRSIWCWSCCKDQAHQ